MSIISMRDLGCVLLGISLLSGCGAGDPLGRKSLSGSVKLNGSPVEQGTISFDPEGNEVATTSGAAIKAGEYKISQDAGLPPGKYRVRINIPEAGAATAEETITMPGEAARPPVDLAPPEWNSKSKQTIEIKVEGPFVFDFDVIGNKKK